jgi:oligoendopeptidase F
VNVLCWIATIDAFQHWIYTNPGHSRTGRRTEWLRLRSVFGGIEDYSGYAEAHACNWHRQGHLFGAPFYYIEYGIAQLGALQLWLNARKNTPRAIRQYRAALALGGSRPLPELFKTAGLRFDFSARTVAPLVNAVQKDLEALEDA